MSSSTYDVSLGSIIKTVVILIVVALAFVIRDIMTIVFLSLILAAALNPMISRLERRGVPRAFGITILYVILLGMVALILVTFVPVVTSQLSQLLQSLPDYINHFWTWASRLIGRSEVPIVATSSSAGPLGNLVTSLFQGLRTIFGGLLAFIGVMILTFYLTLQEQGLRRAGASLVPKAYRPYAGELLERIEARLGSWLRGQLLLGAVIATVIGIGLGLLHVKFALALALIAGLTELIPTIGPYLGMIPALVVAFSQFPLLALWVAILYYVVQQLENNLLVPRIMAKATGLNPIVVLIAILAGAELAGIVGIILSVPTVIILSSVIEEFLQERRQADTALET
ncbi:MAG: AI-2E family transporter [Candidatus Kerfeldbacteria bacterium]|nr:AI-2E family transporter [Candidatus Kerfeldbacteria bacterium]